MINKDTKAQFSSYVFLNDEKTAAFFCKENPDSSVKYGRYEMRIRDKILIEKGYVTKAKVKWWGDIDYQYPYLWKADKSDAEYKESWGDPRVSNAHKITKKTDKQKSTSQNLKNSKGRSI